MDLIISQSKGTRRMMTEVTELQSLVTSNDVKFLLDESPADDPTSDVFLGRILPKSDIYNQAAFRIEINLPGSYPYKGPEVRFITPIYHPNVDNKGKIRLDILNASTRFNPNTLLRDIVVAVGNLIDNPTVVDAISPGEPLFNYTLLLSKLFYLLQTLHRNIYTVDSHLTVKH